MGAENGHRITEHGLYAGIRGPAGAPPLLFLHGGPGQGCYDFMAIQGDLLGGPLRLIGLDQRGVDRSTPLPDGASLTVAGLVEDCEAARRALGIDRWAVLGQSFGGRLALMYAAAHPRSVSAVIFENPVWDLADSARAALPRVAAMLAARGRDAEAQRARAAAAAPDAPQRPWAALRDSYVAALAALGEDREQFFVPDPGTRARLAELRRAHEARGHPDGEAGEAGSMRHHLAILADDASAEPVQHLLARVDAPALLITGGLDPVTTPAQRGAFRRASPRNRLLEFADAGHFVHADDSLRYAAAVADFARSEAADISQTRAGPARASGS